MNVSTIEMPAAEAQAKLEAYKHQLTKRTDDEYERICAGYAALAKGSKLIELSKSIEAGGWDAIGRPRLAIARADTKQVALTVSGPRCIFDSTPNNTRRIGPRDTRVIRVQTPTRPRLKSDWDSRGFALVPLVPADVRPHVDMKKCAILWEVEAWASERIRATPDVDPYLLKHIGGDLWAVLAEWDLTPLERAIMAARRDA